MPSYMEAFHRLRTRLQPLYDPSEATAIAREALLHLTGRTYSQALTSGTEPLPPARETELDRMEGELAAGRPLQYVLGYAHFMGRTLRVTDHVLIPRPETEELVQWIIDDRQDRPEPFGVLDIGTGSGCIPVSLQLSLPLAQVTACDISPGALEVARANNAALGAAVQFLQLDFLDVAARTALPSFDVIVSNPPYIPIGLKDTLHPNVRDHEPGTALFVPDGDALLFYRHIAAFGKTHLREGGAVYCELHAEDALATGALFEAEGYRQVALRKDLAGHVRMLKAQWR